MRIVFYVWKIKVEFWFKAFIKIVAIFDLQIVKNIIYNPNPKFSIFYKNLLGFKILFTGICTGITLRQGYNTANKFVGTATTFQVHDVHLENLFTESRKTQDMKKGWALVRNEFNLIKNFNPNLVSFYKDAYKHLFQNC